MTIRAVPIDHVKKIAPSKARSHKPASHSQKLEARESSLKTNAAQASHLDRIGLALCSVTLVHARGMGEFISHALRKAPVTMHSANRHLQSKLCKSTCNTTVADGQSCHVWRTCEEAATPGQPGACRSTLLEEPSQPFTLENRWAPPALPQCSGRAHRTSRSMSALCASHAFASSKNPSAFVQKLWMPAFPCGSSWKIRPSP